MINSIILPLLFASALASPIIEYEKQLVKKGFNLKVLHEAIEKASKEVEEEFGGEKMQSEIAALRADYIHAAVHSGNETQEKTELEINDAISADLYEGDLELTPEQWKAATEKDPENPATRRQALTTLVRMWKPIGQPVIPYNFTAGYPVERMPVVKAALDFWQDRSCIRFRPATVNDTNLIQFNHVTDVCSSTVGMKGGVQNVNLGSGCQSVTVIAHEISHAFGTLHVQSRSDRDEYIRIDTANIKEGKEHNFLKEPSTGYSTYDVPYEFGSMQHYPEKAFALNTTLPTIYATGDNAKFQYSMEGPRATFYDTLLVNRMYQCTEKCTNTITCKNNGVQHGSDCKKCFCPRGWAGINCEIRPADAQIVNVETLKTFTVEVPLSSGEFLEKLYILQAPVGKKIQANVTKLGEYCSAPKQGPVISESNSMLIWAYNEKPYRFFANIAISLI